MSFVESLDESVVISWVDAASAQSEAQASHRRLVIESLKEEMQESIKGTYPGSLQA